MYIYLDKEFKIKSNEFKGMKYGSVIFKRFGDFQELNAKC